MVYGASTYILDGSPLYEVRNSWTGHMRWQTKEDISSYVSNIRGEMFIPRKMNCEVVDMATGHVKRRLTGPRQSHGKVIQATSDWIYTKNYKNEILRWRAR